MEVNVKKVVFKGTPLLKLKKKNLVERKIYIKKIKINCRFVYRG